MRWPSLGSRSRVPTMTSAAPGGAPMMQCAAVMTVSGEISEPPQTNPAKGLSTKRSSSTSAAIQGSSPGSAGWPPNTSVSSAAPPACSTQGFSPAAAGRGANTARATRPMVARRTRPRLMSIGGALAYAPFAPHHPPGDPPGLARRGGQRVEQLSGVVGAPGEQVGVDQPRGHQVEAALDAGQAVVGAVAEHRRALPQLPLDHPDRAQEPVVVGRHQAAPAGGEGRG